MSDTPEKEKRPKESVYRYLFFLYNGEVTVINFEKHGQKKFCYEKREGEKCFPISDDFWDWWKRAAAYINGEPVDFCFLFDNREYSVCTGRKHLLDPKGGGGFFYRDAGFLPYKPGF